MLLFHPLALSDNGIIFYFSFQVFVSKIQKFSSFLYVNLVYCDFAELIHLFCKFVYRFYLEFSTRMMYHLQKRGVNCNFSNLCAFDFLFLPYLLIRTWRTSWRAVMIVGTLALFLTVGGKISFTSKCDYLFYAFCRCSLSTCGPLSISLFFCFFLIMNSCWFFVSVFSASVAIMFSSLACWYNGLH